jgi:hypothetical protein
MVMAVGHPSRNDGSFFITLAPGDYTVSVFSKPKLE